MRIWFALVFLLISPAICSAESETPPLRGPVAQGPRIGAGAEGDRPAEPHLPALPAVVNPLAAVPVEGGPGGAAAGIPAKREEPAAPEPVPGPPADVERVPALAYLAKSGAKITDLGTSHGLLSIVARQGEQFMLFAVAPDGQAIVAGVQSDFPVVQLLAIAGGQVTELGTAHGLRGLFVRNGAQFQVFYATPDGERLILGVMWDATGKNVTREQVKDIPGAVPTAVIGPAANEGGARAPGGERRSALDAVKETFAGIAGSRSAPLLWMFIDPLCSYSTEALQQLRPFVARGRVQVAIIPVSVLDYEDQGKSTSSALALLSKSPDRMVASWAHGDISGQADGRAPARLRKNMEVAEVIGLRGTPTLVWRKADGSAGRVDGLPADWNAVIASMEGDTHAGR